MHKSCCGLASYNPFASVWQTRDKSYGTRKTNYTVVLNNCTLSLFCNKRKICDYYCDKHITSPTL